MYQERSFFFLKRLQNGEKRGDDVSTPKSAKHTPFEQKSRMTLAYLKYYHYLCHLKGNRMVVSVRSGYSSN